MTKFESVGVNMQYNAVSKEIAIKRFSRSCEVCCNKGMHIDCDRCSISCVHKLVIASFDRELLSEEVK